MQEYATYFYSSKAWKDCRAAYRKSKRGLCEVCLSEGRITPGVIVHHKIHITPENINDPNIVLNWDNLQLVCRDCHAQIHDAKKRRYRVDNYGHVIL